MHLKKKLKQLYLSKKLSKTSINYSIVTISTHNIIFDLQPPQKKKNNNNKNNLE